MSKRIIFLVALVVMFAISCEDSEVKKQNTDAATPDNLSTNANAKIAPGVPVAALTSTCGGSWPTNSYSTPNSLYTYPSKAIDVSCATTGATITILYDAMQLPNRFTVKDAGGVTIASSGGWRGFASYGGPWGPSLSTPLTGSFAFTKAAGVSTYYLFVETLTPSTPNTDTWSATASCTCVACTPSCPTGFLCQNGNCVCVTNCATSTPSPLGGSYGTANSLYTYTPTPQFTIPCTAAGTIVTVYYDALVLPNRFTVKTLSGTTLATSGWKGNASYGGPWGPSINTFTGGSLTFTKVAGQSTYQLVVETLTPASGVTPGTDTWSAGVSCQ